MPRERREHLLLAQADMSAAAQRSQSCVDAGLAVDQRAITAETEHLEVGEPHRVNILCRDRSRPAMARRACACGYFRAARPPRSAAESCSRCGVSARCAGGSRMDVAAAV